VELALVSVFSEKKQAVMYAQLVEGVFMMGHGVIMDAHWLEESAARSLLLISLSIAVMAVLDAAALPNLPALMLMNAEEWIVLETWLIKAGLDMLAGSLEFAGTNAILLLRAAGIMVGFGRDVFPALIGLMFYGSFQ